MVNKLAILAIVLYILIMLYCVPVIRGDLVPEKVYNTLGDALSR